MERAPRQGLDGRLVRETGSGRQRQVREVKTLMKRVWGFREQGTMLWFLKTFPLGLTCSALKSCCRRKLEPWMHRLLGFRVLRFYLVRIKLVLQAEAGVMDAQVVVIAAAGQLLPAVGPLEAADLLLVRGQAGHARLVPPLAHVPVVDHAVPAARAEDGVVPGHAAHAVRVPVQLPDLLAAAGIPDLHLGIRGAHREVLAVSTPRHAADVVALTGAGAELLHTTGAGIP